MAPAVNQPPAEATWRFSLFSLVGDGIVSSLEGRTFAVPRRATIRCGVCWPVVVWPGVDSVCMMVFGVDVLGLAEPPPVVPAQPDSPRQTKTVAASPADRLAMAGSLSRSKVEVLRSELLTHQRAVAGGQLTRVRTPSSLASLPSGAPFGWRRLGAPGPGARGGPVGRSGARRFWGRFAGLLPLSRQSLG